jgi:hypothetical protein
VERTGVRSVSVVCSGFLPQAKMIARLEGFPDIALAEYPVHPSVDDDDSFRRKLIEDVAPAIIRGLAGQEFA